MGKSRKLTAAAQNVSTKKQGQNAILASGEKEALHSLLRPRPSAVYQPPAISPKAYQPLAISSKAYQPPAALPKVSKKIKTMQPLLQTKKQQQTSTSTTLEPRIKRPRVVNVAQMQQRTDDDDEEPLDDPRRKKHQRTGREKILKRSRKQPVAISDDEIELLEYGENNEEEDEGDLEELDDNSREGESMLEQDEYDDEDEDEDKDKDDEEEEEEEEEEEQMYVEANPSRTKRNQKDKGPSLLITAFNSDLELRRAHRGYKSKLDKSSPTRK